MNKILPILFVFLFSYLKSQNLISGKIYSEFGNPLSNVLVVNINSSEKTEANSDGNFSIKANPGDELRFVKDGYERASKNLDGSLSLIVMMSKIPTEIEEVKVGFKPSGDLQKDSKALSKDDKVEQLQDEIGLPKTPEKPRETPPPTKKQVGILGYVLSNANLNNLYKNISGDARRMRRLYKYEDLQDNIKWIRDRIDDEYFIKSGIPAEKIPEFLSFSFSVKPEIVSYIKARNISKVMFKLEEALPKFIEKLKVNKS